MIRIALILLFVAIGAGAAKAQEAVYEGKWVTTNRKLEGIMTCVVKPTGPEQWHGRFYGVWGGVPFDYTVKFTGSPSELRGRATIDGADYTWTGAMAQDNPSSFEGKFTGNRYTGYFDLKEKAAVSRAANPAVR